MEYNHLSFINDFIYGGGIQFVFQIGEFSYQKRKAADKCQNPDFKISCPNDCGCPDTASLISQVTNENDGTPFDIGIKCVKTVNSSKSNFEIFCDENGNGVHDENELSQVAVTKVSYSNHAFYLIGREFEPMKSSHWEFFSRTVKNSSTGNQLGHSTAVMGNKLLHVDSILLTFNQAGFE